MIWDLCSCTHFKIICEGGNEITVQCTGQSKGIDIKPSSTFVNFGEVRLGSSTNRLLTINNNSEITGVFEVLTDETNIFSAENTYGIIKPNSYARVLFNFRPQKTINYYQRVYIIIRNHKILFLDLIGNCYDLLIKPQPLNQNIIHMFRNEDVNTMMGLINTNTKSLANNEETSKKLENADKELSKRGSQSETSKSNLETKIKKNKQDQPDNTAKNSTGFKQQDFTATGEFDKNVTYIIYHHRHVMFFKF